jgi:hypothetical protein
MRTKQRRSARVRAFEERRPGSAIVREAVLRLLGIKD